MAQLIFAADPRLGAIVLPSMIYHPLQLVVCAVLAERWAKRAGEQRVYGAATISGRVTRCAAPCAARVASGLRFRTVRHLFAA
jgi:hypothetical protein